MKKFLLGIVILLSVFSFKLNVDAADPGLLRGKTPSSVSGSAWNMGWATDGNENTHATLGVWSTVTYTFDEPQTINVIKIYLNVNIRDRYRLRFYDSENQLITTVTGLDGYRNVNIQDVKKVSLNQNASEYLDIYEFELYEGIADIIPPSEINDFQYSAKTNSVNLQWINPSDEDFKHVNIYKESMKIGSSTNGKYEITNLLPGFEYQIKLTAVDTSDNESFGVNYIISTIPDIVEEIKELKVTSVTDKSITLKWKLPQDEYFDFVRIYRKVENENQSSLTKIFGTKVFAANNYTSMFETNGTMWRDLTVKPGTTYEYKLTALNIGGIESEGVTIQTTTPAPPPAMGGEKIEKDENGDFKLTWTSPTTGQVKILVDGNEYAIVDASLQEYVIPADDMVYDWFGNPKVQLIAIDEDGKEGNPSKPPVNNGGSGGSVGVNLPDTFNVNAFLKTVMSLIAWVGPFILLALAIRLAPRIVKLIKDVIARYREGRLRL